MFFRRISKWKTKLKSWKKKSKCWYSNPKICSTEPKLWREARTSTSNRLTISRPSSIYLSKNWRTKKRSIWIPLSCLRPKASIRSRHSRPKTNSWANSCRRRHLKCKNLIQESSSLWVNQPAMKTVSSPFWRNWSKKPLTILQSLTRCTTNTDIFKSKTQI